MYLTALLFGAYTRCTGFFCLAIIKGPPNDIYCIIEEPSKHYFTEKVSYSHEPNPEMLTSNPQPKPYRNFPAIHFFSNQTKK